MEKSLLEAISRIEASQRRLRRRPAEQMLSLGLALQQQDRHGEAIEVFKRGVHLARINNGLYCPDQVPLLGRDPELHRAGRIRPAMNCRAISLPGTTAGPGGRERADALMQQATTGS